MDYGAYLKRSGVSHNAKSKTYVRQSTFAGSLRQARGAILRELSRAHTSPDSLIKLAGTKRKSQFKKALHALESEGMVHKKGKMYALPD